MSFKKSLKGFGRGAAGRKEFISKPQSTPRRVQVREKYSPYCAERRIHVGLQMTELNASLSGHANACELFGHQGTGDLLWV